MTRCYGRHVELAEHDAVEGVVLRVPAADAPCGNRLALATDAGNIEVLASRRRGHTVLEVGLKRAAVRPGDVVRIVHAGWRERADGRRYRLERLEVLARAGTRVAA